MSRGPSAIEQAARLFRVTERQAERAVERWLDEVGPVAQRACEDTWPSSGHPENEYATDTSVRAFEWQRFGNRVRIRNKEPYSGWAEEGYTRAGKATAKPWKERGSLPYCRDAVDKVLDDRLPHLAARLTGGRF